MGTFADINAEKARDPLYSLTHSKIRDTRTKQKAGQVPVRPSVLALPIFPGRLQPSIVGRSELNFRVRNGNGWTLALINTNFTFSEKKVSKENFVFSPYCLLNSKHYSLLCLTCQYQISFEI